MFPPGASWTGDRRSSDEFEWNFDEHLAQMVPPPIAHANPIEEPVQIPTQPAPVFKPYLNTSHSIR